jgi:hypothetical protein
MEQVARRMSFGRLFVRLPLALVAAVGMALYAPVTSAFAGVEFCLTDPPVQVAVNGKPLTVQVWLGVPVDKQSLLDHLATKASIRAVVNEDGSGADIKVSATIVMRDGSHVPALLFLTVPSQRLTSQTDYGVTGEALEQHIRVSA